MSISDVVFILLLSAVILRGEQVRNWDPEALQELYAPEDDGFGFDVAMNDNFIVVGSFNSTKLFQRSNETGSWSEEPVATFPDSAISSKHNIHFRRGEVAISPDSNHIVISNPGTCSGTATFYHRDSSTGQWTKTFTYEGPPDTYNRCTNLAAVAISDKMAAVASNSNSYNQCGITILRYNDETGEWQTVKTQKPMGRIYYNGRYVAAPVKTIYAVQISDNSISIYARTGQYRDVRSKPTYVIGYMNETTIDIPVGIPLSAVGPCAVYGENENVMIGNMVFMQPRGAPLGLGSGAILDFPSEPHGLPTNQYPGNAVSKSFAIWSGAAPQRAYIYQRFDVTGWDPMPVATIDGYTSSSYAGFSTRNAIAMTDDYAAIGAYYARKVLVFVRGCAPGQFFNGVDCVSCGLGTYGTTGSRCEACPAGRFGGIIASSECILCPAGRFSTVIGAKTSSQCTNCEGGRYNTEGGGTSAASCTGICVSGRYGSAGATVCTTCDVGHYADQDGMGRCTPCPAGRYGTVAGAYDQTTCLPCPSAASSEPGSNSCTECSSGRYSAFSGDKCNKCAPGSSTDNLAGQRQCSPCQAGLFQNKAGAGSCNECPMNYFAGEKGSANCTLCPKLYSTGNGRGATVCTIDPSALEMTKLEQVAENFKNGIAYVVTMLICGVFGALGFAIFQLRSKDARLVSLTVFQVGGRLALSAVSLVSEAFLLAILFATPEHAKLGALILIMRLLHALPTAFILSFVFTAIGEKSGIKTVYKQMFAKEHFLQFIYPYASLAFLCCFDSTLIFAMPWYFSEFANLAQGYPDMKALRITSGFKIAQDLIRFICNVIYLSDNKEKSQDAAVDAFFIINILISLASIVLAAMVLVMKSSILMEVEKNGGTTNNVNEIRNKSKSSARKQMEGGDEEEGGGDGVVFEENPMHQNDIGTLPLREWLMESVPNLDAPAVHATSSAFQRDGIETFNDLVECIKGKVIDMGEIKNYTREGKLTKMDTLAIIKAVEEAIKAQGQGSSLPVVSGPAGVAIRKASIALSHTAGGVGGGGINNDRNSALILDAVKSQTDAILQSQKDNTENLAKAIVGALHKAPKGGGGGESIL